MSKQYGVTRYDSGVNFYDSTGLCVAEDATSKNQVAINATSTAISLGIIREALDEAGGDANIAIHGERVQAVIGEAIALGDTHILAAGTGGKLFKAAVGDYPVAMLLENRVVAADEEIEVVVIAGATKVT